MRFDYWWHKWNRFLYCRGFCQLWASVIITGRTQDRIDAAVAKLSKGKAFGIVLDNTQVGTFESKHTEMLEMVKKAGISQINILVNNAGVNSKECQMRP